MNLNVDGYGLSVSFNISGKDNLMQRVGELMQNGTPFQIKTNWNGESYYIHPIYLTSVHMPSGEAIKYHGIDELQYQLGIAMMFCTEIVPLTNGLPDNVKMLLPDGVQSNHRLH